MSKDEAEREERRLQVLAELGIVDSMPEQEFDEIVELAAAICGTPISLISLSDRDRQWFKSALGLGAAEIPREGSFCSYAIQNTGIFVVEDATKDHRFADSVYVTGGPKLRFYAGYPLVTQGGDALGTLCVLDTAPRLLTADQTKALGVLAKQVQVRIDLRAQRMRLAESLRQQEALAAGLRASEAVFRTFMDHSPYVSYIKDADGRMVFCNREFSIQFGVTTEQCVGKFDHELWPEDQAKTFRQNDLKVLESGELAEYQELATRPDGTIVYYRSLKFPYEDGNGNTLLAGVSVDVTEEIEREAKLVRYQKELEEANARLLELAVTDALTGLGNRRSFDERLSIEYPMARRHGRNLSVILIDIDDFKSINDRLGHAGGDNVLREVGRLLKASVRLTDLAVRYGGEEFAILLPESDLPKAMQWAERLRETLRRTHLLCGPLTVSMGVAAVADTRNGDELVRRADEALYSAKRTGKNAAVAYEPRPN